MPSNHEVRDKHKVVVGNTCDFEDCNKPISDTFGVKCVCGLCNEHCIEECSADFECTCMDDLLDIRFDFEFEEEAEMQEYARTAKVVITKYTKPIITEGSIKPEEFENVK